MKRRGVHRRYRAALLLVLAVTVSACGTPEAAPTPPPLAPIQLTEIPVERALSVVTAAGATWVGTTDGPRGAVSRLDEDHRPAASIDVGQWPHDMVAVDGSIWLISVGEGQPSELVQIDAATSTKTRALPLPGARGLATGAGRLWTVTFRGRESMLQWRDPATGVPDGEQLVPTHAIDVAAHDRMVWVLCDTLTQPSDITGPPMQLVRVDPTTVRVKAPMVLPAWGDARVAVAGDGSAWVIVMEGLTGTLFHVGLDGRIARTVTLDRRPTAIASGVAGVWVGSIDGSVYRIDESTGLPADGSVARPVSAVDAISVTQGEVWVVGRDGLVRIGR